MTLDWWKNVIKFFRVRILRAWGVKLWYSFVIVITFVSEPKSLSLRARDSSLSPLSEKESWFFTMQALELVFIDTCATTINDKTFHKCGNWAIEIQALFATKFSFNLHQMLLKVFTLTRTAFSHWHCSGWGFSFILKGANFL